MDLELNKLSSFDTSLESLSNAAEKLNEIATLATESLESGGLHNSALAFCNIALESYGAPTIESTALVAMPREKTTADLVASAKEGVKKVIEHVLEMMKKLWEWVKEFAKNVTDASHRLKSDFEKLHKQISEYNGVVSNADKLELKEGVAARLAWGDKGTSYDLTQGLHFHTNMVEDLSQVALVNGRRLSHAVFKMYEQAMKSVGTTGFLPTSLDQGLIVEKIPGFTTMPYKDFRGVEVVRHVSPQLPGNAQIVFVTIGHQSSKSMRAYGSGADILDALAVCNVEPYREETKEVGEPKVVDLGKLSAIAKEGALLADRLQVVINADMHELDNISRQLNVCIGNLHRSYTTGSSKAAFALSGVSRLATKTPSVVCGISMNYARAVYDHVHACFEAQTVKEAA